MTTKITLYNSYESRYNGLPSSLPDLIKRLTEMLEEVPTEFHDDVYLEMSTEYESSSVEIDVYYMREETQEEEANREAETALQQKKLEDRLRQEYQQLKKRFEP